MSFRLRCVDEEIALSYDNQYATVGDEMDGFVTYGDDWVNFYFQCASSADILNDLLHNMNELYDNVEFPSITSTPAFSNGSPCAARYMKDNKWYRARLVDVSYSMVHFVDYGNRQITNLENVKPLTRTLAELVPPLAYQCRLANFQNPLLPSFVDGADLIRVTVHSKHEPYEVSVQVLAQNGSRTRNVSAQNGVNGHGAPQPLMNGHGGFEVRPRTTPQGLTLPSLAAKFNMDEEDDDDLEKLKNHNKKARIVNTCGKLAVVGAAGRVSQLYATCGQVTPEGLYQNNLLDFNSQETTLNNGVLWCENLTRIFRINDRVICNARYEDPLPNGIKVSKPPAGYYQVTDMQLVPSNRLLVSHAVVTFVSNEGAILYVRNRKQSVFAPASVFPSTKADAPLSDFVELGRSVLVRAVPAEKFPDIQVSSEWVANAVEFLGNVVENQGWMYFVRENYSVIITEGGIGFGYVFSANQFVDPVRVTQEEWFGTRALFRACLDVPDKENFRFGNRWKALSVRLLPEHSKGSYRYQGIYKPLPVVFGDVTIHPSSSKKSFDDEGDDNFDLPEEALEEMRMMGKDSIGVNRLSDPTKSKADLKEIAENLLNECEDIPPALLTPPTNSLPPGAPSSPPGQSNSAAAAASSNQRSTPEVEIIFLDNQNQSQVTGEGDQQNHQSATTTSETFVDLLGINETSPADNFLLNNQPKETGAARSSCDLLQLWEGGDEISKSPLPLVTPRKAASLQNGVCPSPPNEPPSDTKTVCDRECQTDREEQLRWEIEYLRQSPELFLKVVSHVTTLPVEVQQRFFTLLANTSNVQGAQTQPNNNK